MYPFELLQHTQRQNKSAARSNLRVCGATHLSVGVSRAVWHRGRPTRRSSDCLTATSTTCRLLFQDRLRAPGRHSTDSTRPILFPFCGRCQGENKVGGHGSVVAVLPQFFYDIKYVGGTEHRVDACFVEKVELVRIILSNPHMTLLPSPLCR